MARFFDYAVIRLAPNDARDERLNIGALIFKPDGIDVRVSQRLDKVRAISAAIDADELRMAIGNLSTLDEYARSSGAESVESRYLMLSRIGPLALSSLGKLEASDGTVYETRLEALLRDLVDPEPAPKRLREKRSKLLTQIKKAFAKERVLAKRDETLDQHRIMTKYEVGDGLVADLVLKNGLYHVVETVDVSREDELLRKAISEIGVAALVLESARIRFGDKETKARLVYNASVSVEKQARCALEAAAHQGTELVNWASTDDRMRFVVGLTQLATPLVRRRPRFGTEIAVHPKLLN